MKEFLYINYNLIVDRIYQDNTFFIEDEKIKIVNCKEDINKLDKLIKISNELYNNKILVDTFIINKEGNFYTQRNKDNIILLKINDRDDYFDLKYILKFVTNNDLESFNIVEHYKKQIDDFEEKITKYNKEYKIIQKSTNYYIGMAENAISLLSEYKNINEDIISHNINLYKYTKENLNNPLNFIKTNKMYSISNYIKHKFIINKFDYNELEYILNNIQTEEEEALFFGYMLYPNYYFDQLMDNINEKEIIKIIKLIPYYTKILVYIREKLKKCKKIKLFVWLN